MGKARRFDSYSNDVDNERNISQLYGQARQNLSGVGSSFRSSPLGVNTVSGNPTITSAGDNLGNHTATQDLNLAGNDIILSSDGDTKFGVVGANVLFMCSNSGSSTEVFRISPTELQMAQNIDANEKDIEKVNMITFKDDHNNNFIRSSTSGIVYNAHSNDHHKFYSGLTALVTIDTANISLGATLDMSTNNISECGNISFSTSGQNITTSADGLLYQATNPDTHDFLVSAVSRFEVEQSKISLKEDTEVTGGKKVKASNSTEIAFQVTDNSLTVGSKGTMEIPYVFDTNSLSTGTNTTLDGYFGDNNGCIGIQFDTDASAGTGKYRLWVRVDGGWYKMEAY